jgi:hypothetical protein
MKKLDSDAFQKLKSQFEGLPPRQTLRPADVIAQLVETISGAQARGYEIDDVMAMLHAAGITLARNTVRNYLSRARAARRKRGKASPSPTVGTTNSAPSHTQSPAQPQEPAALVRAQQLRNTKTAHDSGRRPGSFELVPDKEDL